MGKERPAKSLTALDLLLGRRVMMRRRELRMSQSDVAQRLGIPLRDLRLHERGELRIGISRLAEIADILDVPAASFFKGAAAAAPSDLLDTFIFAASDANMGNDVQTLLGAFLTIADPLVRKDMIKLIHHAATINDY